MISIFPIQGRIDPTLLSNLSTYSPELSKHKLLFYWGSSSELVVIAKTADTTFDVQYPTTVQTAKKPDLLAIIKEHQTKMAEEFKDAAIGEQRLYRATRTQRSTSLDRVTTDSFMQMTPWKSDQVFCLTDEKGEPVYPIYYIISPDWKDLVILMALSYAQKLSSPAPREFWTIPGKRLLTAYATIFGLNTSAKHVDKAELYRISVRQCFITDDSALEDDPALTMESLDEVIKMALPKHKRYKKAPVKEAEVTKLETARLPYFDLLEYGAIKYAKEVLKYGEAVELDTVGLAEQFNISFSRMMLRYDGVIEVYTAHPNNIEAMKSQLADLLNAADIIIRWTKEN